MKNSLFMRCNTTDFNSSWKPSEKHIIEKKFDGTRVMLFYNNGIKKMVSERSIDCSIKYPEIVEGLKLKHGTTECILDGEVCVFVDGKSEFQRILNRNTENKFKINILRKTTPVTYVIFDILSINGESVRHYPLEQRKKYLENVVEENEHIILAKDYSSIFGKLVKSIKENNLEGYIIKNKNSVYVGKKSHNWIKAKWKKEIILKFTDYEIHNDKNGYTYTNGFDRISVNGGDSSYGVSQIKMFGFVMINIQYLRKNPSGRYYQGVFKEWVNL